ncbi:DNAJA1 [Symbiodinium pilosum]|uniref:DNAJA1 protein n=1 Tax=Symbiodinium pilosum TaxID=2952 RepID=A0A812QYC6_SYMPI|nr:DNAJA1 [Symbiodinium pilosum]
MSTFYEELGVEPDIDQAELKKVLRKKALEYHPDKHPEEEQQKWTEKFQYFQQIMETLQDESSRRVYDEIHLKLERTGRILVLMDMNGSLLCKLGKDGRDAWLLLRSLE